MDAKNFLSPRKCTQIASIFPLNAFTSKGEEKGAAGCRISRKQIEILLWCIHGHGLLLLLLLLLLLACKRVSESVSQPASQPAAAAVAAAGA